MEMTHNLIKEALYQICNMQTFKSQNQQFSNPGLTQPILFESKTNSHSNRHFNEYVICKYLCHIINMFFRKILNSVSYTTNLIQSQTNSH